MGGVTVKLEMSDEVRATVGEALNVGRTLVDVLARIARKAPDGKRVVYMDEVELTEYEAWKAMAP